MSNSANPHKVIVPFPSLPLGRRGSNAITDSFAGALTLLNANVKDEFGLRGVFYYRIISTRLDKLF